MSLSGTRIENLVLSQPTSYVSVSVLLHDALGPIIIVLDSDDFRCGITKVDSQDDLELQHKSTANLTVSTLFSSFNLISTLCTLQGTSIVDELQVQLDLVGQLEDG